MFRDENFNTYLKDVKGDLPIHTLCRNQSTLTALKQLELGHWCCIGCVDKENSNKEIPLHCACQTHCDPDIINILTKVGSEVNARDINGRTPLHYACANLNTSVESLSILIKNGASVKLVDRLGKSPIHYLIKNKYHSEKMLELLLDNDADPFWEDSNGIAAIDLANESEFLIIKNYSKKFLKVSKSKVCIVCKSKECGLEKGIIICKKCNDIVETAVENIKPQSDIYYYQALSVLLIRRIH